MMNIAMRVATFSMMCLMSAAASAHHSAAMFDHTRCGSVTGTVRNLQWQYPHSWLWIVATDDKAQAVVWGFEMPAPSALTLNPQWTRDALPKGEKVTVYFSPLADGRQAGLANAIQRSNSSVLHAAPNAYACEAQLWQPGASGSPGDAVFKKP